ncbi:hypothetical protein J1605_004536 [Eschrichtius robustus]|uniref:Elongation of very long chain fatty acids protein n=1 Tax=Eschrichtius robustus TaxID=9764 RepID=A0AB34HEA1_ESCRO|nr:hypothetical protein J1605_004536 [Eschrichtius robustus]
MSIMETKAIEVAYGKAYTSKSIVKGNGMEHLKAFDDEINAFLDNMFGPRAFNLNPVCSTDPSLTIPAPTGFFFRTITQTQLAYAVACSSLSNLDSRVRGWFMLDSYLPTFSLTVLYLLCIWLGNKYMRSRAALSLRGILTLYNLGITLLSAYMLAELILSSWEGGYNLQCQDLTSAGEADIRKNSNSYCTFLGFFGPTLNSFIHILMYTYYGLSVFPSMHKYLWWKKYLTQAQLVQFVLTVTHTMSAVVRPCGFPFGCLIFQSSYMLTLVILFLNFYVQVNIQL